ncbi:MAG: hypothetical protein E7576_04285 [Ruminococcaceae bacterium]|nr:hypothetical protein [Oscillospiraceae bacterium]
MKVRIPYPVRYAAFALLLAASCFVLGRGAWELAEANPAFSMAEAESGSEEGQKEAERPLLVIDPGHGGEDGGASVAGILEKDLNLAVSLRAGDLCAVFGIPVLLTRTTDTLLYDAYGDLEDYRGKQKTYDLRNRLRMAEESGAAVFLSVHQNQFPKTKYSGMQVYYSPNDPGSAELAARIRQGGRALLDPYNTRETKAATNAIYLLHRIRIPAALAECGFLSNPEERELLSTPSYQTKVAAALIVPTAEFLAQREER